MLLLIRLSMVTLWVHSTLPLSFCFSFDCYNPLSLTRLRLVPHSPRVSLSLAIVHLKSKNISHSLTASHMSFISSCVCESLPLFFSLSLVSSSLDESGYVVALPYSTCITRHRGRRTVNSSLSMRVKRISKQLVTWMFFHFFPSLFYFILSLASSFLPCIHWALLSYSTLNSSQLFHLPGEWNLTIAFQQYLTNHLWLSPSLPSSSFSFPSSLTQITPSAR